MNRYNNMLDLVCALATRVDIDSATLVEKAQALLADLEKWEKDNPDPNILGLSEIVQMRIDLETAQATIAEQTAQLAQATQQATPAEVKP